MHPNTIEVWTASSWRCLLFPHRAGWELQLVREHQIVKRDLFSDGAAAIAAADGWRDVLTKSSPDSLDAE